LSLSSYNELRQAIQDWTLREDLAQRTDDFIAFVEADLNRRLRVRRMLTRDTFTADAQYEALPSDFLAFERIAITSLSPDRELEYVTPQAMSYERQNNSAAGVPFAYSIVGDEIEFLPTPGTDYTVERLYYASIPALTSVNTSNWVLTQNPDVYLHGCLSHAFKYAMDEQRAAVHAADYASGVQEIIESDKKERIGAQPRMRMRPIGRRGTIG